MEPHVQYARAADGVSIAYQVFGKGPPLVIPPSLMASHVQIEWQMPTRRDMLERLAERATVVRYDPRGVGMSQRDVFDFSLGAATLDLEAVVDELNIDRFALYARYSMGALPLAYAAAHTDRVTHLILVLPQTSMGERGEGARATPFVLSFAGEQWGLCIRVLGRLFAGWDSPEARILADIIRASHTPASLQAAGDAVQHSDPLFHARQVRIPALIVHPSGDEAAVNSARQFAAVMSGAHVLGVPGKFHVGNPNAPGVTATLEFINSKRSGPDELIPAPAVDTSVFRTILFTDLVEHTSMMQRLGDEAGRAVLREHERIMREALRSHGGFEVKTIGDSFMASFPSAQLALDCAVALQQAFESADVGGETLRVRVGVNAGEPIAEDEDLFGSSVILAARAKDTAGGGQIVVTDVVRQLVTGKGFLFADRGAVSLHGFEEPVRLYELRRDGV